MDESKDVKISGLEQCIMGAEFLVSLVLLIYGSLADEWIFEGISPSPRSDWSTVPYPRHCFCCDAHPQAMGLLWLPICLPLRVSLDTKLTQEHR